MTPARHLAFDTDEGTWLSVTSNGRQILFDMLGDLYAVDARGGEARAVTTGMAFDSQPVFSPDGSQILFVSDRSGAENLWVSAPDGSGARRLTANDEAHEFVSPAWSPDGKTVYASLYRSDRNAMALWRYPADGSGKGEELTKPGFSALGAAPAADGRHLYFAGGPGNVFEDDVVLPLWSIHRLDLVTGADETVVVNQGSAMRPVLSPDGRMLAYAARLDGKTTLRLRDLRTGADRQLLAEITHDVQEALPSRDLVPAYQFTADGKAILISLGGKLARVSVADGSAEPVPFTAHVALDLGPFLRQKLTEETGPVRARLIQAPVQSPDGRRLAFSALGRLYVMDLAGGKPRALIEDGPPQYQPAWSPDGRSIAYVTWESHAGGRLWRIDAKGGRPSRLTDIAAYYSGPAFSPDGGEILALRSSAYDRLHTAQEPLWTGRNYGPLRQAELVALPASGGKARLLASGQMSGEPQFASTAPGEVFLNTDKGLEAIARDGSGARRVALKVTGRGYYFMENHVPVDDIKLSPDGRWAMVQNAQRLYLLATPDAKDAAKAIDLDNPTVAHRRLWPQGADFFAWADGGRTLTWALGSTFWRRPLSAVTLDPPGQAGGVERVEPGQGGLQAIEAVVAVPRDEPKGVMVLRGATVITMKGDEVIPDADLVVTGGRITAVGRRGEVAVPKGAMVRDLSGRFITPGFIDVHDHFGEIRRGVLDFDDWGLRATLAYGVTTGFDPSTLSIDMFAYQDALDAGMMTGPRLPSTGTAVFSFNQIDSLQDARDVVSRYVEHYRTRNLKAYRTGPRRSRQWIAMAAAEQGSMPTTEGALDMKLDLTQVIDGFSGNEHALAPTPLYRDVVELMARSRVSYDTTMMISHGGPPGGEIFTTRTRLHADAKLESLYPHFIMDRDYTRVHWVDPQEVAYPLVAAGAAKIARAGGVVSVGSHGNYPGIGYPWELQAYAAGGMTPMEVLHAATMGGAETIGRASEIGSLEPGKLADLVVLDRDPRIDIANAADVAQVMKNGRLYDATSLAELAPDPHPLPAPWFASEARPGH
jgi:Tol biopolymer transport system component